MPDVPDLNWVTLIPLLIGVIMPPISSFISREHWPTEITAGLTVLLSAITGFVSQAVASGTFSFSKATLTALGTYVFAAIARSQFWRKSSVDAKLLAFPRRLPRKGESQRYGGGVPDDSAADEPASVA